MTRISIVVPCFNAVATAERTMLSLISQGYADLQIIVMDGGSTDGSMEIFEKYRDHIDVLVSRADKGQADALNNGFDLADGELFGWLCADDELAPGALKAFADQFAAEPDTDVITGGCIRSFGGRPVETTPDPTYLEDLTFKNTIEQPSTLWRSRAHRAAGQLDTTFRLAFDWEFWCRMKAAGARFRATPKVMSIYHFSATNLTSTAGRRVVDEMDRVIRKYGPYGGRIVYAYRLLYHVFDLKGFYDRPRPNKPRWQWRAFSVVLRALTMAFDAHRINSYNWNFASRQERGLDWE